MSALLRCRRLHVLQAPLPYLAPPVYVVRRESTFQQVDVMPTIASIASFNFTPGSKPDLLEQTPEEPLKDCQVEPQEVDSSDRIHNRSRKPHTTVSRILERLKQPLRRTESSPADMQRSTSKRETNPLGQRAIHHSKSQSSDISVDSIDNITRIPW